MLQKATCTKPLTSCCAQAPTTHCYMCPCTAHNTMAQWACSLWVSLLNMGPAMRESNTGIITQPPRNQNKTALCNNYKAHWHQDICTKDQKKKAHPFLTSYHYHLVILQQVSSLLPAATSAPPSCAPISDHTRGQARPSIAQTSLSTAVNVHSVFNMLNLFHACWFVNCNHCLSLVVFAQKVDAGNEISWVKFTPQAHSHLVHQALALASTSYPLALCKRVIFVFLLEVINNLGACPLAFFVKTSAPGCQQVWVSMPAPSLPPSKVLV